MRMKLIVSFPGLSRDHFGERNKGTVFIMRHFRKGNKKRLTPCVSLASHCSIHPRRRRTGNHNIKRGTSHPTWLLVRLLTNICNYRTSHLVFLKLRQLVAGLQAQVLVTRASASPQCHERPAPSLSLAGAS